MKVAIYVRCSSASQDTAAQLAALQDWASRAGHTIVRVFEDKAISGKRGRDRRPGFDAMLKAAVRREFEMIATYSVCRLARSMGHLYEALQTVRDTDCGLYIHTTAVDTTTPAGRALFQMLGVFSEFETELRQARCRDGIEYARAHGTRSGKAFGRPKRSDWSADAVRDALLGGMTVRAASRATGASPATCGLVRKELITTGKLVA